ncbi:MAG TPA: UvrD-helicase domain-containing protein [Oxalicibacterium sp.]|uniref:UvrD-helicase domain-containing protein n=1 Tax=Oxalicibacterium sp. TaxID=2766525 RepID=UPI002C6D548B|nr:UvrD-helicase domain-containing protein [Oxalicibacterium sp.]HWU96965.1 UvrD-helicase domain-containing protein [Oxalicibacterium sp.]
MSAPQNDVELAHAYEINGAVADAAQFTAIACDPARSVVVEACAGSGKTWLLVARVLRLLLAGTEPAAILAITFTRKAAQEMRERLLHLLQELALASDQQATLILLERGITLQQIPSMLPSARSLYERVLRSPSALSIDTFHSWFARLIQIAPLASGVPHGYTLTEATGELHADTYSRFMQSVNDADQQHVRQALVDLYQMVGDWNARNLLNAFVDKRAEWWAAEQCGQPLDWLCELCGEDGETDARLSLWQDEKLIARVSRIAWLLGQGTDVNQKRAVAIEQPLSAGATLENFAAVANEFFDAAGKPRKNRSTKNLTKVLIDHLGDSGVEAFEREFDEVGDALKRILMRSTEPQVIALNRALFVAGAAYLELYQAVKAEQRVFDFSDLEWQAYRLLSNEEHAAYLQSRLDSRYQHVLLDEFQDTNPLQWGIVQAWLAAYGSDHDRPSMFVVGDPKQSIYRFRRAEPRVFTAAREQLTAQGADFLRTNQTRRNAQAIVDVMNASLIHNPIFKPQTTLSGQGGAVWKLPLAKLEEAEKIAWSPSHLRDPLTTSREEQEDERRLHEGRAVAQAILRARSTVDDFAWSDVMMLVKKRTHLRAYERALREAGIPFISDKRGGLLASLEIADLIALLTFLITPNDNLALAHVLKSPIIGASDDDLIMLASRTGRTWWQRLHQCEASSALPVALQRAIALLSRWLQMAPHLPVHDLLDRILHEGDVIARYASSVSPLVRAQVLGNIEAFTELALNLDAGRYPSLPKFIHALNQLQKNADSDAPDEADADASTDAVRIMTIHSAKGLEARIVVLLDANHSEAMREDIGVLCEWSQEDGGPRHFSAFGKQSERGVARDRLFEEEEQLKTQEDWNLLYVAITRAKNLLIVSGVADGRSAASDGVADGCWYGRILGGELMHVEQLFDASSYTQTHKHFELPIFTPASLPAPAAAIDDVFSSAVIDEGIALHALMERLTDQHDWPVTLPSLLAVAQWLNFPAELAQTVHTQASAILTEPALARFFDPAAYRYARNEMEVVVDGATMRFDRLVMFDDELWILDYKRNLLESERLAYAQQLEDYRAAAQEVFPDTAIRTALITVDGRLIEMP